MNATRRAPWLLAALLAGCGGQAPAPRDPRASTAPAQSDMPDLTIAEVEEMRDAGLRDAADVPRREPDIL